jgi:FkbM family methyltransferase
LFKNDYYELNYLESVMRIVERAVHTNSSFYNSVENGQEKNILIWEINTIELLSQEIEGNEVLIDVGANYGAFSLMAKLFPGTRWYAFEPSSRCISILLENLELNLIRNVHVVPFAVLEESGYSELRTILEHPGLGHFGVKNLRLPLNHEKTSVFHCKLDDMFESQNVDLIKIDVEGAELSVLKGAAKIIERCRPKILVEISETNLNQFNIKERNLRTHLKSLGYKEFWRTEGNSFFKYLPNKRKEVK